MFFHQKETNPFSHQLHLFLEWSMEKVEFFRHWNQQATYRLSPQRLAGIPDRI